MKLKEIFDALHISVPAMFAGLAGGAISMFRYRDITLKRGLFIVGCSAITSGYITKLVIHKLGIDPEFVAAIGFLIGCFFFVFYDLFISLAVYAEKHPKETISLLLSILPFSKLKSNTKNEEADENSSEFGPDPGNDTAGGSSEGPKGI
jgi:hypothetical protein